MLPKYSRVYQLLDEDSEPGDKSPGNEFEDGNVHSTLKEKRISLRTLALVCCINLLIWLLTVAYFLHSAGVAEGKSRSWNLDPATLKGYCKSTPNASVAS